MAETAELNALFAIEDWNADTISQVKRSAFLDTNSCERFRSLLGELERGAAQPQQKLKLGLGYLLLGRTAEAADTLQKAPDSGVRDYYLGCALRELGRHKEAVAAFERAGRGGWDEFNAQCERAVTLLVAGDVDQAKTIADQLASRGQNRAAWHYLRGRLMDVQGQIEPAIAAYEKAVELDPQNGSYLFRLAAVCDLYGDDDRAVELYRACAALPVVSVNTLLNLAVISEDIGEHEDARDCVLRVLASNPSHPRARLYLRDVEASMHMYIDEEQERERAERTAILDTPISEFELSVRSRNCLKKMNIFTLGDLLRISEAELLAYKNFGETSLSEIKVMLSQKGLQLGQLATAAARPHTDPHPPAPVGNPDLLNRPVAELELSVRSRKCLQRLMISSIGELVSRTEPELLATRNFGQTSLSEIKRRLTEMGLSLRRIG